MRGVDVRWMRSVDVRWMRGVDVKSRCGGYGDVRIG